ncbi:Thioesterase superfamily [Penicillium coprophilum]|uniref:Thioesterase superfamily n=1 Tax=Penicillium coprophilum TaxID=36646 RepID=UPI002382A1E0|nr:Thioesterase superfamily [Penicillium coprophilum]KAJ5164383.1 Thioesterase superfamily [Penicillium coprophilum]
MSNIAQTARRLFRSQNLSAFRPYSPVVPIARLHQQGPTRSAVVHDQALPSQTETPAFISQTQSQSPHHESTTLDTIVSQIPLVQTLRETHSTYKETRPHLAIPPPIRQHHFVGGSLSGPGKLAFAPYMWLSAGKSGSQAESNDQASSVVSVFHIGQDLCGHPGFVHGGLLTVLFDEVFARCVSAAFPSGLGMTANLNVDFRKPALPDRMYVLRTKTTKVEGRKAWVEGQMTYLPLTLPLSVDSHSIVSDANLLREDSEGAVMVAEAKALFIEPKFADSMVSIYSN